MENDFTLTIKGFKNMAQVKSFASWYSNQGEQQSSEWFEIASDLGKLDVSSIDVDSSVPQIETENNLTITVKPQ